MSTATHVETIDTARPGVPLSRIVKVELRKMFDTRSGFWLMASIAILAALATIGVILFVPDENITLRLRSARPSASRWPSCSRSWRSCPSRASGASAPG